MIINHNMMAMNTHRQMGTNATNNAKSIEKLSSGLRINRAGDDAAGLAISEKMRGQIRGLNQASRNAQDGISLMQTAEGALNETHSILQRMRELSVQAATDTNTADDRAKIQSEVDQLSKEITRISNTTEFNTQNLMAGGLSDTFQIGANEGQHIKLSIGAMDAESLGVADSTKSANTFVNTNTAIATVSNASRGMQAGTGYRIVTTKAPAATGAVVTDKEVGTNAGALAITNGANFTGTKDTTYIVQVGSVVAPGDNNAVNSIKYSTDDGNSWITTSATAGVATIDGMTFTMAQAVGNEWTADDQYHFTATAANATIQLQDSASADIGSAVTVNNNDTSVTIGSAVDGKTVEVAFSLSAVTAGTDTFNVTETTSSAATVTDGRVTSEAITAAGINVSNSSAASAAITKINDALEMVSNERSKLGAMQNRLEHTIRNLDTSSENLQASESRVRDIDMAKEMMNFTKNNILQQAAQSMLAQANQAPQGVLQLLR